MPYSHSFLEIVYVIEGAGPMARWLEFDDTADGWTWTHDVREALMLADRESAERELEDARQRGWVSERDGRVREIEFGVTGSQHAS